MQQSAPMPAGLQRCERTFGGGKSSAELGEARQAQLSLLSEAASTPQHQPASVNCDLSTPSLPMAAVQSPWGDDRSGRHAAVRQLAGARFFCCALPFALLCLPTTTHPTQPTRLTLLRPPTSTPPRVHGYGAAPPRHPGRPQPGCA